MHDETHCILQLIMRWVWSCKFCTPFKEAVSLQHVEHSSKHAVFLLKKCSFPSGNYSVFGQSYSTSFKTPDSYTICSVWLTLSIAVKMCSGWCSLQHSLKERLLKENLLTGYSLSSRQDSPLNEKHYSCKKVYMWKDEIQPFMDFSLPLIFRLRHFFIERLNFFKIIALKTMFSLNKQATLWQKKNQICGKMQYILYEVQPLSHFSEWQLSLKERRNFFKMKLPTCSGVSPIWAGILHAYNHDMYLSKNTTYTQGFYFKVMCFLLY